MNSCVSNLQHRPYTENFLFQKNIICIKLVMSHHYKTIPVLQFILEIFFIFPVHAFCECPCLHFFLGLRDAAVRSALAVRQLSCGGNKPFLKIHFKEQHLARSTENSFLFKCDQLNELKQPISKHGKYIGFCRYSKLSFI